MGGAAGSARVDGRSGDVGVVPDRIGDVVVRVVDDVVGDEVVAIVAGVEPVVEGWLRWGAGGCDARDGGLDAEGVEDSAGDGEVGDEGDDATTAPGSPSVMSTKTPILVLISKGALGASIAAPRSEPHFCLTPS